MARHGGAKIATRVANTVSKSIVLTHNKLLNVKYKLAMMVFHAISDTISDEVHRTLTPVMNEIADRYPQDGLAHGMLTFMTTEKGQLQSLVGTTVSASGLLSSIAQIMNNELAPAVQDVVGANPRMVPDAGTVAQLNAHNLLDTDTATATIGYNGFGESWAQAMISDAKSYPSPAEALTFLRMGLINFEQFSSWAGLNGYDANSISTFLSMQNLPVSAADAALAYLRNDIDQQQAEAIAAQNGMDTDAFNIILNNTGEPLGLEQLLEAYRRQYITLDQLKTGILESRVRDEWIPTAISLAIVPMSTADAVNSVVQNNLDSDTAQDIAYQNGLDPSQFPTLVANAGEPLSRTEMEDLYNRGEVTEDQVTQALRESRLKNKYNDLAFLLHTKLLQNSALSDAVLHGSMDQATAVAKAMENGLSADDAVTMVLSASNAKMYDYRTKVVEDVVNLFEVNAIDQTTADGYIQAMGFSEPESQIILQAASFNAQKRLQQAAISVVRSKYVAHHITIDVAQTDLQQIGVPAGQIAYMTNLWEIEQSANVKLLTPAQVVAAVSGSIDGVDEQWGLDYLGMLGYQPADAQLLLDGA